MRNHPVPFGNTRGLIGCSELSMFLFFVCCLADLSEVLVKNALLIVIAPKGDMYIASKPQGN